LTATSNQISQTFYIFSDILTNFTLIGQFSIIGILPLPDTLSNYTFIPYGASPQLSKIGIVYKSVNSSILTIVKSIDYVNNTIIDLNFQDINRLIGTVSGIPPYSNQYYLGDYYYIQRNITAYNSSNPQNQAVEEAYQYVGNQIVFLKDRNLTGKEFTDFKLIVADTSYTNQLVVLVGYNTTAGLEVDQYAYGNVTITNNSNTSTPLPPNSTFN
jgi:hypothetical protein